MDKFDSYKYAISKSSMSVVQYIRTYSTVAHGKTMMDLHRGYRASGCNYFTVQYRIAATLR